MIIQAEESIDKRDWDNIKFRPKRVSHTAALEARLTKKANRIHEVYEKLLLQYGKANITKQVFSEALNSGSTAKRISTPKEKKKRVLISDFFQQIIDDSLSGARRSITKLRLSPDSVKPYSSCLMNFKEFEEHYHEKFYIHQIDQALIENFEDYLFNIKGLCQNTKSTYLKKFKIMIDYAKEKQLLSNTELSFRGLLGRENSDAIYLDDQNLKEMMAITEFSNPTERLVRDLFVLACKTGLRFSDYSKLAPAQIRNGNIYVLQKKTKDKVTIPIHPIAKEILGRYPNGFIDACPANQPFNNCLKDIAEKVPSLQVPFEKRITKAGRTQVLTYIKGELLQSHTARRTFCTLEYLNGTEIPVIMAISGHKDVKTFLSYVKASSELLAEKIKKNWLQRGE